MRIRSAVDDNRPIAVQSRPLRRLPPRSARSNSLILRIIFIFQLFTFSLFFVLCQKHPTHPAYPTLKVKNLTCGMSGTGGLFSYFPYYHARELPAPPFFPCPFAMQYVVTMTAYLAPRTGFTHLELLLRQFSLTICTNHVLFTFSLYNSGTLDVCSPSGRGTPNSAATCPLCG